MFLSLFAFRGALTLKQLAKVKFKDDAYLF